MAGDVASRPRVSPFPMVEMDDAIRIVNDNSRVLEAVNVPIGESLGYYLADDVVAQDPLPPYRASIMDGYAVVAASGTGDFRVVAPIVAGDSPGVLPHVGAGEVCRITTGAPVSPGADAVVMVENTELVERAAGGAEGVVRILVPVTAGTNIRAVGCDIASGDVVLRRGARIGPTDVGLLASLCMRSVRVHRRPRVALLSTGTELVDVAHCESGKQQIVDSNRPALLSLLREAGYECLDLGIVGDTEPAVEAALRQGLDSCDVLITTGGVSMGETDLVKPMLLRLGCTVEFGRIRMKPGKPTTVATLRSRNRVVFALPGNPVSAIVTFHLLVLPSLSLFAGAPAAAARPTRVPVTLQQAVRLDPRPEYQRAIVSVVPGGEPGGVRLVASVTGGQASSRLASMRAANALLELPPATDACGRLEEGAVAHALLIGPL